MAVRYKFRSSANFDSIDIDGRSSISVRDLKLKVIQSKKLNICQDFDLVLSDGVTGQEYTDENFQISSGSSIIIKRVPAGLVPTNKVYNSSVAAFGAKDNQEFKALCPKNVEINFDDFGADLCPFPVAKLPCPNIEVVEDDYIENHIKCDNSRSSEHHTGGCENFKVSDSTQIVPGGSIHSRDKENNMLEINLNAGVECNKTRGMINMENSNFPSELKCSLCHTLLKEAVMIPCCQHSFCLKCIHSVLVAKGRCPKCFSSRCRVEDLLPNLSLRQAIEHFTETQMLFNESDNALCQYAPDGESGIQEKGRSYAMSVIQREPQMSGSSVATERGSNYIDECDSLSGNNAVGDTGLVNQLGGDDFLKSCSFPSKVKKTDVEKLVSSHHVDIKSRGLDLEIFAECQGESQPIEEDGVDWKFQETERYKKGTRTCYMCGSPDHFIRDCPAAFVSDAMFKTGAAMFPIAGRSEMSPYWNGPPLSHMRPLANIYSNPGMMPFNTSRVPVAPYTVPSYMPSMFSGVPVPHGGFMTMRGMAAQAGFNMSYRPSRLGIPAFQGLDKKRTLENEYMTSGYFPDDVDRRRHAAEADRLHDLKAHNNLERSESYSQDHGRTYRSQRKYCDGSKLDDKLTLDGKHEKNTCSSFMRDLRPKYHAEKRSSNVENMRSSPKWHGDDADGHKKHSRILKRDNERIEYHDDCSRYPTSREKHVERKRVKVDAKRRDHKHDSLSESGLGLGYDYDEQKRQKKTKSSHVFRYSEHCSKFNNDEVDHDRWLMDRDANRHHREDYRSYKRKRVY